MKYSILKSIRLITTLALLFALCPQLLAAPPPPPGVPLDGGISFLIIAAVGYGASKMTKDSEKVI